MEITKEQAEVMLEQLKTQIATKTANKMIPFWSQNLRANIPSIRNRWLDLEDAFGEGVAGKRRVAIIGPGPSLADHRGEIHKLVENHMIIAGPTVVPWLMNVEKVTPDLVVVADANPSQGHDIRKAGYVGPVAASLYASPTVSRAVGDENMYWIPIYQGIHQLRALDSIMYHMFEPDFVEILPSMGDVMNLMITIASKMYVHRWFNFKAAHVFGADHQYTKGYARVPKKGTLLEPYDANEHDLIDWDGEKSNGRMIYYKALMMKYWQDFEIPFYFCGEGMQEFPHIEFEQAVAADTKLPYPTKVEIRDIAVKFAEYFAEEYPRQMVIEEPGKE